MHAIAILTLKVGIATCNVEVYWYYALSSRAKAVALCYHYGCQNNALSIVIRMVK